MDARQLEYVVAVADHGGFTAAAKVLHVSQPALSQSIAALEAELGVALFDRIGRTVTTTSAGEEILIPARQVQLNLELARAAVDDVASLQRGRLEVVALPTLAVEPVARLVGLLRQRHPGIEVDVVQPEDDDALLARLRSGESEVGFAGLPVRVPSLVAFELDRHDYVAVLPTALAPRGRSIAIGDLAHLPLLVTPTGTSSRRVVEEAFAAAGHEPTIGVVTDHREAMVPLVLAGAGVALLPRPLAVAARDRGAEVRAITPVVSRRVGVIWRAGPVSPAARAFLELAGVDDLSAPEVDALSRPRPRRRRR